MVTGRSVLTTFGVRISVGSLGGELHYNGDTSGRHPHVPERPANVKSDTPNNGKPFVDVSSFQRFLSAAYVVQQHNDRIRGQQQAAEYSSPLSQFAEIEEEIRKRGLDLPTAAQLIAQPAQQVAHADGVAIAIVEKDQLAYYAAVGSAAPEAGTRVAQSASVCAECLQSGELLQCPDAERDWRVPAGFCRDHSIKALLAAPAKLQGKIVGVVELRFSSGRAFREEDTRNCQLMADLLAGVVEYAHNLPPQATASSEHEEMLETLERIKPQLAQLAGEEAPAARAARAPVSSPVSLPEVPAASPEELCPSCGRGLGPDEQFCGFCGTRRSSHHPLQSTWSSLWDLQRTAESKGTPLAADEDPGSLDVLPSEMEALVAELSGVPLAPPPAQSEPLVHSDPPPVEALPSLSSLSAPAASPGKPAEAIPFRPQPQLPPAPLPSPAPLRPESAKQAPQEYAPWKSAAHTEAEMPFPSFASGRMPENSGAIDIPAAQPAREAQWTSAIKTREWLDSVKEKPSGTAWLMHQWKTQRANFYLAAAAALLVVVLLGGGSQDAATSAVTTAKPKSPPQPELSFFEKALVNLGLAEPPPAPVDSGNPTTKVWVDVHTALYYCPGEELYGKTSGGRYTNQQDAQMDAFQPAARKPCN